MPHNGGNTQVNFWFLGSGRDFPFLNVMKTAGEWFNAASMTLNEFGYPESGTPGCAMGIPSTSLRPGNYVFEWDGLHTINLNQTHSVVSGSKASGSHRAVLSLADGATGIDFNIGTITQASTHIKICHEDDEEALDGGEIFGVKFIERLQEANFGVLRFLDWQLANTSMITHWAERKPVGYRSYNASEFRPSLMAGTTTNSGDDYSITFSGYAYTDKAKLIVRWNADASGTSPTLNVNGLGAKTIRGPYGDTLFSSERPTIDGYHALLVYDERLDCFLKLGGNGASGASGVGTTGLNNCVPPEIMLALCNKVNAHPWLHVPFLALDPITDYATELATLFRDGLNSGLKPRFEPANEIWNFAAGFYGTRYAWNVGQALSGWGGTDFQHEDVYGKWLSLMGQAIHAVYSPSGAKTGWPYQVIGAVQTSGFRNEQGPGDGSHKRFGGKYVSVDGGSAASNWATHVAMANYFYAALSVTVQLQMAHDYNAADTEGKAEIAAEYIAALDADPGGDIYTVPAIILKAKNLRTFADEYGLRATYYEGGYSPQPDYLPVNATATITGMTNANPGVFTVAANSTLPPVGSSFIPSGMSGSTGANGQTIVVAAVDSGTRQITGNRDTTGDGTWTSGGIVTYVNSMSYINTMRAGSKNVPALRDYLRRIYSGCMIYGEFPSCYLFSGVNVAWAVLDDTNGIWVQTDPPQWLEIVAVNNERRDAPIQLNFAWAAA
jgi:hypothetical protein